jgi:hypothetical protein
MSKKQHCDDCTPRGNAGTFPLQGGGFSRRNFLRVAGTGLVASYFADVLNPKLLLAQYSTNDGALILNTAKNCIFIFLQGAPSQVDTFDLKEGSWTPADFAPTSYLNGALRLPQGLLPKTSDHAAKLSIVRSGLSWAAVHQLGQTWAQIARNPGGATGAISPHIGAVVSLETQSRRDSNDVLPGFVALNSGAIPTSGYLPATYAPFGVTTQQTGLATLSHPEGTTRFNDRWGLLQTLDANRRTGGLAKLSMDMNDFYTQSKTLMEAPGINDLFKFTDEEHTRYGASNFGDSLVVARNLVNSSRGVRFVQATLGGWDHHSDIYDKAAVDSLYASAAQFDPAFGALLGDLSTMPGSTSGKTLLDETLIVVLGEFGRTAGPLTGQGGRDHFLRMSTVFAGGGVKGGTIIGKTDTTGANIVEYGWKPNRDVRPEDVTSTIYSALGIDYTIVRTDDPLNRGFEYVPEAKDGHYEPIAELFA